MKFRVLGVLEVVQADGTPVPVPGVMNRRLLAVLLAARGEVVQQSVLGEELWGEDPPKDVAALLRSKVSVVRRALRAGGTDKSLLEARRGGYALVTDHGASDIDEFDDLLAQADTVTGPERIDVLKQALGLWRSEQAFADIPPEGRCGAMAVGLGERRLDAYEDLLSTLLDVGRTAEVMSEVSPLVVRNPHRERLRSLQMLALYREGRQGEALAVYRDVSRVLAEELGIDPGPELVAVHEAILRQSPELLPEPPTSGVGRRYSAPAVAQLPEALTGLVGREWVLRQVHEALATSRLVTLSGPGGVGKTRVAVESGREVARDSGREVWFVELASIPAVEHDGPDALKEVIARRIIRTLGLSEEALPGAKDVELLCTGLVGSSAVLLLDNVEHVVDGIRSVVESLLRAVPDMRVMLTSREPLRLPGETVVDIPPLEAPPSDTTVNSARGWSALELFETRARDMMRDFEVDADNAAAIAEICRGVDSLPLGIELVAPRLRALSPADVAARLGDLLQRPEEDDGASHRAYSGVAQLPGRQRTLDAVIEWSWDLLTVVEQGALLRLSVSEGSWSLPMVEAVLADLVASSEAADVVVRLVDRSLLGVVRDGGEARYLLSESVRRFCSARCPVDVDRIARDAHLAEMVTLLSRTDRELRGPTQVRALETLDREQTHLDRALVYAVERGLFGEALSLAVDSVWYSTLRGQLHDGERRLSTAVSAYGTVVEGEHVTLRRTARTWLAALHGMAGSSPDVSDLALTDLPGEGNTDSEAEALMRARGLLAVVLPEESLEVDLNEQCLAAARMHGYRWGEAAALSTRAWDALYRGDFDAVVPDAEASRELFAEEGDEWGVLHAGDPLAAVSRAQGDIDRARALVEDGLGRARRLGLWPKVTYAMCELGWLELDHGDPRVATERHAEAVRLAARQGTPAVQQLAEVGLAVGERRRGDVPRAAARLERWLAWNRHRGWSAGEARVLVELGRLEEVRGRAEAAEQSYATARRLAAECGDVSVEALATDGLAWTSFARANREAAERHLFEAERMRREGGLVATPEEQRRIDDLASRLT